jgi:hypothetical protein
MGITLSEEYEREHMSSKYLGSDTWEVLCKWEPLLSSRPRHSDNTVCHQARESPNNPEASHPCSKCSLVGDCRRAELHLAGLPRCKWTWKGAESSTAGFLRGQTVALNAVGVVSLPKPQSGDAGTVCFSHKAITTGLF